MTFYLKFWVTCNLFFMYRWAVAIEIKANKGSVYLIVSPSKLAKAPPTHSPTIFVLFLIWTGLDETKIDMESP